MIYLFQEQKKLNKRIFVICIIILITSSMKKQPDTESKPVNISEKFIDQLYSLKYNITDEKGNELEIPESGFLGLLATGYKGLAMLRKKRGQTHLYYKFTKGKRVRHKNPNAGKNPAKKNNN